MYHTYVSICNQVCECMFGQIIACGKNLKGKNFGKPSLMKQMA